MLKHYVHAAVGLACEVSAVYAWQTNQRLWAIWMIVIGACCLYVAATCLPKRDV